MEVLVGGQEVVPTGGELTRKELYGHITLSRQVHVVDILVAQTRSRVNMSRCVNAHALA
jgi:hypothetical protein